MRGGNFKFKVLSEKDIKIVRIEYDLKPFPQHHNVERHLQSIYGKDNVKTITRFEGDIKSGSTAILKARITINQKNKGAQNENK